MTRQNGHSPKPSSGNGRRPAGRRNVEVVRCPYPGCGSDDIMPSFNKSRRIFFWTSVIPRLRRWNCRSCTRHFWWLKPKSWSRAEE